MNYINLFENYRNKDDFTKNSVIDDVVYHGTYKLFTTFQKSIRGSYGKGFYFTKNEGTAFSYGNIILNCLLNLKNPFYLNESTFNEWSKKYYRKNKSRITKLLIEDGYDSLITENEILVFDETKIKII